MSDRQCPVCGGTNTSAVVNDVQWHTKWVTRSSARQERHILAGCGCRDCKATWEQWDVPAGYGAPFNVSEPPADAANYADDARLSHFYEDDKAND
jgi:hypothetical protein